MQNTYRKKIILYSVLITIVIFGKLTIAVPSFRNKCNDPVTGKELYIGESFTRLGQCIRVQCLGNLELWSDKCQTPNLSGNCVRISSTNDFLEYPKCCPQYECKIIIRNEQGNIEETNTYDHYGQLRKSNITQILLVDPQKGDELKTQFSA